MLLHLLFTLQLLLLLLHLHLLHLLLQVLGHLVLKVLLQLLGGCLRRVGGGGSGGSSGGGGDGGCRGGHGVLCLRLTLSRGGWGLSLLLAVALPPIVSVRGRGPGKIFGKY